jgi:hypothetical protein
MAASLKGSLGATPASYLDTLRPTRRADLDEDGIWVASPRCVPWLIGTASCHAPHGLADKSAPRRRVEETASVRSDRDDG